AQADGAVGWMLARLLVLLRRTTSDDTHVGISATRCSVGSVLATFLVLLRGATSDQYPRGCQRNPIARSARFWQRFLFCCAAPPRTNTHVGISTPRGR